MLTPGFLERFNPTPHPWGLRAATGAVAVMKALSGTRLRVEGFAPPRGPVLYATNGTQRHDFLALRYALARRGVQATSVTKARTFHEPTAPLARWLGSVPLASRGYVLAVDFRGVTGRRPTDEEYRRLRDHLDRGAPLPDGPVFEALLTRPRVTLGHHLEPARNGWAWELERVYEALMAQTLRLMRVAVERGHSLHMYPEGTVAPRLGVGRPGVVQAAHALGLDVVPVGMNGCAQAFAGDGVRLQGGVICLRFGEPLRHPLAALPASYRAFVSSEERAHRPALLAATETVMARLDALLDPELRRDPHAVAPPTQVSRFL